MRFKGSPTRFLSVAGAAAVFSVLSASAASAQLTIDPTHTPTLNNGGWVWQMAVGIFVIGVLVLMLVVVGYMRFAPRFTREEGAPRTVRADRIKPGKEPPRRPVNITGEPVVVPAPAAAPAPASAPAPAAAAPAPAPTAPAPALAHAAAPSAEAAGGATLPTPVRQAEAAAEPAPAGGGVATPAPAAPRAPAAPTEHKEVALDQETFDKVVAELLGKGTDRRVAEGQARRAAMIAARKKAGG